MPSDDLDLSMVPIRRLASTARHLSTSCPRTTTTMRTFALMGNDVEQKLRLFFLQSTLHASSEPRTRMVCAQSSAIDINPDSCLPPRTPSLRASWKQCRVSVPRYSTFRRPEQWHPQHDRRGAALDEREDGDLQGRVYESHQAGHQEEQAALCTQLLPPPRLHLELWRVPSGTS